MTNRFCRSVVELAILSLLGWISLMSAEKAEGVSKLCRRVNKSSDHDTGDQKRMTRQHVEEYVNKVSIGMASNEADEILQPISDCKGTAYSGGLGRRTQYYQLGNYQVILYIDQLGAVSRKGNVVPVEKWPFEVTIEGDRSYFQRNTERLHREGELLPWWERGDQAPRLPEQDE